MPDFRTLTFYVIRHGECEHNVQGRYAGQDDSPLTATGREQARTNGILLRQLVSDLEGLDFIASPLHRTCTTIELVRAAAGLSRDAYRADRRLMESDLGGHSGRAIAEVRRTSDHAAYRSDPWNYVRPSGESQAMLYARVGDFLTALMHNAVLVCHAGSMKMVRAHYLNLSPMETLAYEPPHAGILLLEKGEERVISDAVPKL